MSSAETAGTLVVVDGRIGVPDPVVKDFADEVDHLVCQELGIAVEYDVWPGRFLPDGSCPYGQGQIHPDDLEVSFEAVRRSRGLLICNPHTDERHPSEGIMEFAVSGVALSMAAEAARHRIRVFVSECLPKHTEAARDMWRCSPSDTIKAKPLKGQIGRLLEPLGDRL